MEDERDRREKYIVLLDVRNTPVVSRDSKVVTDAKRQAPATTTVTTTSSSSSSSSSLSSLSATALQSNVATNAHVVEAPLRTSYEDELTVALDPLQPSDVTTATTATSSTKDHNMLDVSFAVRKDGSVSDAASSSGGAHQPEPHDNYYVECTRLQKQILYETKTRFYLIGYTKSKHIVCNNQCATYLHRERVRVREGSFSSL
jgi:hypothetical protein